MPEGLTLATAALTTQLAYIGILAFAILIMPKADPTLLDFHSESQLWVRVVLLALFSMAVLLMCEDITRMSRPAFGNIYFPTVTLRTAKHLMFWADLLVIVNIIQGTGLVRNSVFSSALFTLPALALFLRESLIGVSLYVSVIMLFSLYSINSHIQDDFPGHNSIEDSFAFIFVSSACLVLTTFIGYVTRHI
jgi:hypothetical protein